MNHNRAKYKPRKKPDNKYWYNHRRAQNLYIRRRRECIPRAILPDTKEWDETIIMRLRIGDFEGDTVYGTTGKGLPMTLADRKSRFLFTSIIRSRNAGETREAIEKMLKGVPVKSLSPDNGSEFAQFRELEAAIGAPIYFAEPHKPWPMRTPTACCAFSSPRTTIFTPCPGSIFAA